jgi:hypothetical protein
VGLTLPSELTEPLSWIGLTWPEADEELLFEAGQQWISYAEQVQQVAEEADARAAEVWKTSSGDAVDAFQEWWTREEGPSRRLAEDAAAAALIGGALMAFAAITLALKVNFIVQLIILAVEVAQAIATAVVTFGATTAEVPGFIALTRFVCRELIDQVVTHITTVIKDIFERAAQLLKKAEEKVASRAERKATARLGHDASRASADVFSRTRHLQNASPADLSRDFPEISHGINPMYRRESAFNNNCQSCVVATERSLAGDAVSAVPRRPLIGANGQEIRDPRFEWPHGVDAALGGRTRLRPASGYDDIATELESAGHGARGIVHGMRVDAKGQPKPGHVFNAVNRNGVVHFIDGQTGKYAYMENYAGFEFMRTN